MKWIYLTEQLQMQIFFNLTWLETVNFWNTVIFFINIWIFFYGVLKLSSLKILKLYLYFYLDF